MKLNGVMTLFMIVMLLSLSTFASTTINSVTLCESPGCTVITSLYGDAQLNCQVNATTNTSFEPLGPVLFMFYRNASNVYNRTIYGTVANNTLTNSSANATIPASVIIKSDTWGCEAQVYNSTGYTNGTNSSFATVNNTAPVVSSVAMNGMTTAILGCSGTYSDAVDSDTQNASYYRWFQNGAVISGSTTSSINLDTLSIGSGVAIRCEMKVEDRGYNYKNSTAVNSTAYTTGATCYVSGVSSQYHIVDMCTVIKVVTDLTVFIQDTYSPIITLMVLVIVLGAVLSIVGAILYTVFSAIRGSIGGWKG